MSENINESFSVIDESPKRQFSVTTILTKKNLSVFHLLQYKPGYCCTALKILTNIYGIPESFKIC